MGGLCEGSGENLFEFLNGDDVRMRSVAYCISYPLPRSKMLHHLNDSPTMIPFKSCIDLVWR